MSSELKGGFLRGAAVSISKSKPRIVVAEDHELIRKAVTNIITPHFDVVASVKDGQLALRQVARKIPDLVLSDISMPGINGFQLARELKQQKLPSKVVFLTAHDDDDYISEALGVGANGYITKQRMHSDLVPSLNLALAGQYFISPHAFQDTPKQANETYVLEFYLEDNSFFHEASERAYAALASGQEVFLFLSTIGLRFVQGQLRARGVNTTKEIRNRNLRSFSVEHVVPSLMKRGASQRVMEWGDFHAFRVDGWPDAARFELFFDAFLKRAVSRSRERFSKVVFITDLIPALLRQGCSREVVARIEAVWNDIIPRQFCTVYCGCPVALLGSRANREMISGICQEHSNVIPICPPQ